MAWLQPLLLAMLLAMLASAHAAHGHTRRSIGPAPSPATVTTASPAPAGCGDLLSMEVGAGGSLSAVFAVPATGVAAVTFSTCGTVLDAVLAVDGGTGHYAAAGDGDARSTCDGGKNKTSERVLVQVAARRPGVTILVGVRFRNARDTGTLRLDITCHRTSRMLVARSPLASVLGRSPPPPAITCGGSVSLKVAAGGELRRSFAATTPATDVVTVSARGAGDDTTVLVVDGQEVDSARFELAPASAQQLSPGFRTTVIAVRFIDASTAGALRLTVACRPAAPTAAPTRTVPTQPEVTVAPSTPALPPCGTHSRFMSCVQGAYVSNCCTGSCGATRSGCFNCDDPADGGPQCFAAPAVRSCADEHRCKVSVTMLTTVPPTARAPTGAPATATRTLLGAAYAAAVAPTDGLPSNNCGYGTQGCAADDHPGQCWSCTNSELPTIPVAFAVDTVVIDLSGNLLTVIDPKTFTSLAALRILDLKSNRLTVVDPKTFANLSSLYKLDLSSNRLTMIELKTFANLTALRGLYLSSNQLAGLEPATFASCTMLEQLFLDSNELSWLHPTTFATLSALTTLDLSTNQLTGLGPATFTNLSALTTLDLSTNRLTKIEQTNFASLSALHVLKLFSNRLTRLAPATFTNLTVLTELYLQSNLLTELQNGTFDALSDLVDLNLAGNRIRVVDDGVFEFAAMHAGLNLNGTAVDQVPHFLYNPNPLQCGTRTSNSSAGSALWNLRCTLCTQGYVETNASAGTPQVHRQHVACAKPDFRLDTGPEAQGTLDALRLGLIGREAYIGEELDVYQNTTAGDRVFTPKRDKFRGYAPENHSFAAIRFEVKVGEVDIGCGAVVVGGLHGPGSEESRITQTWQQPPAPLPYPPRSLCVGRQRLLRFEVLADGHFDFASCGSRFPASLGVYHASCNDTDNSLAGCLVAPNTESHEDPEFPQDPGHRRLLPLHLPGRYSCLVGSSANLSNVALPKGTYLLGVQPLPDAPTPASPNDVFEVEMRCRGGGATAAPVDPTDGGVVVNPMTGQLTVSPGMDATPNDYSLNLTAIDSAGSIASLLSATLQIRRRPKLALRNTTCGREVSRTSAANIRDKNLANGPSGRHDLGSVVVFPAFLNGTDSDDNCSTANTLNVRSAVYDVVIATADGNTTDLGQDTFVNGRTGKLSFTLAPHLGAGKYSVSLRVRASTGDAGSPLTLQSWEMDVRPKDTATATNGPNGRGCGDHGTPKDNRPQDDAYNCQCDPEFGGENCETPTAAIIVGAVLGSVLVVAVVAKLAARIRRQRTRAISKRHLAHMSLSIDFAAPADALFAALDLDCEHLIGDLLKHGANAAARHSETHKLAHAVVLARPTPDPALLIVLFRAHCDIDAQIALLLRQPGKLAVLEQTLLELVRERWRSPDGSTLLHVLVDSCRRQCLHETAAVHLATSLLAEDPQLLTATDGRSRTVAALAAECDDAPDLERLLTVVVFDRYQLLRAEQPLHRSSTSVVTLCRDLDWIGGQNPAAGPLVLKMMKDEGSWARELHSRGALQGAVDVATTTVPVLSAAVICTEHDDGLEQTIAGVAIHRCPNTALRNARQGLASDMMSQYPFAICMPLAERNLLEIIQSERASGQPIGVLAYTARKIALTIKALHDSGVVHADLKPRNIVRTGGHAYRLIDFDMSFSIHETAGDGSGGGPAGSLPTVHASATKIGASNAYAAPELVQWAVAAAGCGDTAAAGRTAIRSLGTPAQVDILSFGMTLYELITGVPLHAHAYDRLTARALQMVLTDWQGLDENAADQLKALHPGQDLTPTIDLLRWMLDVDPMNRPDSMAQVLAHTFFDPQGGTMREHFLVEQIRAKLEDMDVVRDCPKIMISYCWDDTNFVLGKLGMALAGRVRGLWLDRLGGDQGMGAWARASMDRGVAGADVVIAVLSPKYTQSENCGFEMELADLHDKEVIPVVLGLPFDDWCDLKKVGKTELKTQFHDAETGDGKLFVDFTKPELFETKLNQELLPRLTAKHRQLQSARIGMFEQRWQQQALSSSLGRDTSVGVPPARSNTSAWASSLLGPEAKTRSVSWTSPSTGPTSSQSVSASIGITFGNHANPVFDWQGMSAGASPAPRAGANATSDDAPDPAEIAWTLSGLGEHSSSPA